MVKYRTCYDNGKYNKCIYGRKANTYELGNLFYGPVILGVEVRKQLGHRFIYRVQPGNGYANSIVGKRYQQKYDYFVPDSINNPEGEAARTTLAAAVSAWQALSDGEKDIWREKETYTHKIPGYNLFIRQYFKDNYGMAYQKQIYDVMVGATDADYTSIATAFATEGPNTSFFIKQGSYTETADITPPSGSMIYFNNATVTINGASFDCENNNNITLAGRLSLRGTGSIKGGFAHSLLYADSTSENIDASQCSIYLKAPDTALTANSIHAWIKGKFHKFNILGNNITHTSDGTASQIVFFASAADYSNFNIILDTFAVNSAVVGYRVEGVSTGGNYSTYNIHINAITTGVGNTGYGVSAAGTGNTFLGSSLNCDGANQSIGGGNNATALN